MIGKLYMLNTKITFILIFDDILTIIKVSVSKTSDQLYVLR
jgi:hypothetical protein